MTAQDFTLDARLAGDTALVGDFALSRVLVMNDRRYPWLVLVPRRVGMVEPFDLNAQALDILWRETMQAARALKQETACRKVNVGALGNVVAQLHVHVVARHTGDPAWPGPVWGHSPAVPYNSAARDLLIARVQNFR